jgi:hypothetical protein
VLGVLVLGSGLAVLAVLAVPAMPARAALSAVPAVPAADDDTAVVSLGDSFISGEAGRWLGNSYKWTGSRNGTDRAYVAQTDDYDPKKVYGDTYEQCDRSDVAEVSPTSLPVAVGHYVNIACSGASTDAMSNAFKGEKPQADQLAQIAATYRVRTVVLSIGGNDLDVSGILEACGKDYVNPFAKACTVSGEAQKSLAEGLKTLPRNLDKAILAVRAAMRADGYPDGGYQFVLQGYPSTLPDAAHVRYPEDYDRARVGGCPFYDSDLDWVRGPLTTQVDDTLAAAAARNGVEFLDLRDTLAGREVCSKSTYQADDEHPVSLVTSEWSRFVAGHAQGIDQESLHPDAIAQYALGFCLGLLIDSPADRAACVNTPGEDFHHMKLEE